MRACGGPVALADAVSTAVTAPHRRRVRLPTWHSGTRDRFVLLTNETCEDPNASERRPLSRPTTNNTRTTTSSRWMIGRRSSTSRQFPAVRRSTELLRSRAWRQSSAPVCAFEDTGESRQVLSARVSGTGSSRSSALCSTRSGKRAMACDCAAPRSSQVLAGKRGLHAACAGTSRVHSR
jgi:hypothetical protein